MRVTRRSRCCGGDAGCFERRTSSIWGLNAAGIREMLDIRSTTEACAMLKASMMPDGGPEDDDASICYNV